MIRLKQKAQICVKTRYRRLFKLSPGPLWVRRKKNPYKGISCLSFHMMLLHLVNIVYFFFLLFFKVWCAVFSPLPNFLWSTDKLWKQDVQSEGWMRARIPRITTFCQICDKDKLEWRAHLQRCGMWIIYHYSSAWLAHFGCTLWKEHHICSVESDKQLIN